MKKENVNYTKINYASSSVDVTLESRNYLLEHSFLKIIKRQIFLY